MQIVDHLLIKLLTCSNPSPIDQYIAVFYKYYIYINIIKFIFRIQLRKSVVNLLNLSSKIRFFQRETSAQNRGFQYGSQQKQHIPQNFFLFTHSQPESFTRTFVK